MLHFEKSLPHQLEEEINRKPVAYIPWGAHEWHGAHNPAGLDGIKVQYLADELAKQVGGVVFPTVYCGHGTVGRYGFPYSINFSPEIVESLALDYMRGLAEMGFKVIVVLMGHWGGGHGEVLLRATSTFNNEQTDAIAWAVQDDEMTVEIEFPEDHGGAYETSFIMAGYPDLVDFSQLPGSSGLSFKHHGIVGEDPRTGASAELGHRATEVYVREAQKRIKDMLALYGL